MFFAPVAALLLWATQYAFAIERWRDAHGIHVPQWLDAVAKFEALTAIAAYAFEHPDQVFADIETAPTHLSAVAMAHPLLPPGAVANDLSLGGAHPVLVVVSGSNMSGKSTFLRALGLNVVLAQAGAPVRAASFRLSPLVVGASIRVLDSLQDGRSRFFAEILRLRQVVELARARNGAVVFLLDELLAGTNSHDRREGSAGVLRGLVDLGAIGLATTHDLALADIAIAHAPRAANRHFSDEFQDEVLRFDYQLRDGPVRSSNALALMRSIGLDV
jgi:DNA mismatch repair ATPase MutS